MLFQRSATSHWRASINFIIRNGSRLLRFPSAKGPQANLLLPIVAVLLAAGFFGTQREVMVSVDGQSVVIKTHLGNVGAILRDAGITIQSGDIVYPPLSSSLSDGASISIKRSKPVIVHADGTSYSFRTQGRSVAEAVRDGGLDLKREDAVYAGNRQLSHDDDLLAVSLNGTSSEAYDISDSNSPRALTASLRGGGREGVSQPAVPLKPIELTLERAVPVFIHDGDTHGEIYTTRRVLGDALSDQQVIIHQDDLIFPRLGTEITAKMHVFVLRAKPMTILVDGRTIQARTQAKTIEEAILQEGVKLVGKDRTDPPRNALVQSDVVVKVTRVKEDMITEQESIEFAISYVPDPSLELDERRVNQEGRYGLKKWETRIVYENGEEVSRTIVRQWIETPPVTKVIGYGTKIIIREFDTPDGTVSYWRKFRMWATSYNASHGGKSRDNPAYGLTRTGIMLRRGIVAIDPTVISFYTRVYVPGYGVGLAADTGGGIRGMMIDLGYEETDINMWSARWTDVYLLTPVPPASEIEYRIFDR